MRDIGHMLQRKTIRAIAVACCLGLAPQAAVLAQQSLNDIIQDRKVAPSGGAERWVKGETPTSSLRVIVVRPLPGDTCRDVIFEARVTKSQRMDVTSGQTLDIDLTDLCLLGLRNDAEDRTITLRVGEEFSSISVMSDNRLQAGVALAPGQEILTPIRSLDLDEWAFRVELVWDDLIDSGAPEIDHFDVHLARQ